MAMLVLVTLLALTHAAMVCPTYTCESLPSKTCAKYSAATDPIKLNSDGCPSGSRCSIYGVNSWLQDGSDTYYCTAIPNTSTTTTTTVIPSCTSKNSQKSFKNQAISVTCNSHMDCQLVDGTRGFCKCVMGSETTGICEPDAANEEVFFGYWEDCGTDNTLSAEEYYYWSYYKSVWVYTQSSVHCNDIFFEIQMLSTLLDAKDGAATLAVGVFGLLALY